MRPKLCALGQPLTGHTNQVIAVAFSPDGQTLATGSEDDTVRLWGMNVDQAIQRICATTTNTLTPTTWAQYLSRTCLTTHPAPDAHDQPPQHYPTQSGRGMEMPAARPGRH